VREHAALRAEAETPELPAALLINQPERTPAPPPDAPVAQDTPVDSLRVLANLRPFPDAPPFRAVCRQLIDSLRDVAPFDTAVVYALDEISSDAHALYADGSLARAVLGIRIPVAERLSGWVAAHRTAVWNSDAALDLSLAGVESTLAVGSSLPLCANDAMIGVLSLYGRPDQEISASQRHTLESLLPSMSVTLDAALQRPALAIDCASPAVGDAGLSALDALLSHGRRGEGEVGGSPHVVLSVSIRRAASDLHPSVDLEAATVALAQCLSPATEANRCVLVLGPGHVLLCSLDDASRERLEHEVSTRTAKVRLLADFATTAAFIRSSLELKARVQRVRESLELPEGTTAPPARIH
jgi:hypothetical protein